jgi:HlyD family secretion protein
MAQHDSEDIAKTLSAGRRKAGWGKTVAAIAALVVALGAWAILGSGSSDAVQYETEAAILGDLTITVTATGTVQPTTEVDVSSELSGTLASVDVDYNDQVAVGQVLARLDDTKLKAQLANASASVAAAQARLAQAEASAREAETDYRAAVELDRRGITTSRDLASNEATHLRAQAQVEIARADLTVAQANLDLQQADLEKAEIRSPIKGIVLNRTADVGQIVASSLSAPVLFTLAEDLARMELRVDIDEADIGRVAVGNAASFTVDAYGGQTFPAVITQVRFAPENTDGVVTYKAVLSVENSAGLLRPGMTATATIIVAQVVQALLVPNAALRFAPPQMVENAQGGSGLLGLIMPKAPATAARTGVDDAIWVLRDGVAVETSVTPGETDGQHTALVSGDLVVGDLVITDQSVAE